jgi:hypothetical protein
MKIVRENINEKFTSDSDPIEDLGIGIKASIEHSLNLFIKLHKERKNTKMNGYVHKSGLNDKICFMIKIHEDEDIKIISYFNNIIYESNLNKFLDINDSIINDIFRETEYTASYQIMWVIKDKYVKYFDEIQVERSKI